MNTFNSHIKINAKQWIFQATKILLENSFHTKENCNKEAFFASPSAINSKEEAQREAKILFCHGLNIDPIKLYTQDDFHVTKQEQENLEKNLEKRIQGEPLAYILGKKEFFSLDFFVDKTTLIPRPETELLVEDALAFAQLALQGREHTILDLGCGSGCIGLSYLYNQKNAQGILVDISKDALDVAKKNSTLHHLEERSTFCEGDFTETNFVDILNYIADKKEFDIIISNPPYIPEEEFQQLHTSVKDFEPKTALVSSESSDNLSKRKALFHVEAVIKIAEVCLKPHGLLLIEHGYNQGADACSLCNKTKWQNVECIKDYSNQERYLRAIKR